MNLLDIDHLLNYMHSTYLKVWYNNTLPFKFSKVAEQNEEFRLSEKMVQAIWNDSQFIKKGLKDDSHNPVKIISSGEWNREPGPDFRKAVIEINGIRKYGDVEIHLSPGHWKSHGHHFDPNYKDVILHVVWEMKGHKFPPNIPHLELSSQLSLSPEKVMELTNLSEYSKSRIHPAAECSEYISQISDSSLQTVFRTAGLSRLHRKSMQFKHKVTKFGLSQAFYTSLAEAHGYKNNRSQFIELSNRATLKKLSELKSAHEKRAYIWGCSNLLPDITQDEVHSELHESTDKLWNTWWKLREGTESEIKWNRTAQRPLNSPERRVEALIQFMEKNDFQLEKILWGALKLLDKHKELKSYLENLFDFESNWESFCNYKTKLKKGSRLIGNSRKLDIIINVILPALATLIKEDDRQSLNNLYLFYCKLPKSQTNHVLDIAAHKFFLPPYRARKIIKCAAEQQGLMQLMQDFEIPDTPLEVISFWEELGISFQQNKNDELSVATV